MCGGGGGGGGGGRLGGAQRGERYAAGRRINVRTKRGQIVKERYWGWVVGQGEGEQMVGVGWGSGSVVGRERALHIASSAKKRRLHMRPHRSGQYSDCSQLQKQACRQACS